MKDIELEAELTPSDSRADGRHPSLIYRQGRQRHTATIDPRQGPEDVTVGQYDSSPRNVVKGWATSENLIQDRRDARPNCPTHLRCPRWGREGMPVCEPRVPGTRRGPSAGFLPSGPQNSLLRERAAGWLAMLLSAPNIPRRTPLIGGGIERVRLDEPAHELTQPIIIGGAVWCLTWIPSQRWLGAYGHKLSKSLPMTKTAPTTRAARNRGRNSGPPHLERIPRTEWLRRRTEWPNSIDVPTKDANDPGFVWPLDGRRCVQTGG